MTPPDKTPTSWTPRWAIKSIGLFAMLSPVIHRGLFGEWPSLLYLGVTVLSFGGLIGLILLGASGFHQRR